MRIMARCGATAAGCTGAADVSGAHLTTAVLPRELALACPVFESRARAQHACRQRDRPMPWERDDAPVHERAIQQPTLEFQHTTSQIVRGLRWLIHRPWSKHRKLYLARQLPT